MFAIVIYTTTFAAKTVPENNAWNLGVAIGYTHYQSNDIQQGRDAELVRLSIGFVPVELSKLALGLELGLQTANDIEMMISPNIPVGGVPLHASIKPMLDLMGTLQLSLNGAKTVFAILKGGVVYRRMHFTENTISNISRINPKLQAGFGFMVTQRIKLVTYYQGIYSSSVDLKEHVISQKAGLYSQSVQNIPCQHSVLIGVEIKF